MSGRVPTTSLKAMPAEGRMKIRLRMAGHTARVRVGFASWLKPPVRIGWHKRPMVGAKAMGS